MAKVISIELEKTISDIVSKNFKLGTSSDKIASSILNGFLNKMIFGDETERKTLITMLVPDVLSSSDALKLYNNIIKYKEKEKEQLKDLMSGNFLDQSQKKNVSNHNTQNVNNHNTHQALANDDDL